MLELLGRVRGDALHHVRATGGGGGGDALRTPC